MGADTKIEWADSTWTPIRARRKDNGKVGVHCERVSEACRNCYAATFNRRNLPSHGTGLDFVRENRKKVDIFVDEDMLTLPLRWRKPRKIFVCSQTDLFAEFVTDEMIDRVFELMALAPWHTYQVLTKRPERMQRYITSRTISDVVRPAMATFDLTPDLWPLPNVWLGVTAEDQQRADERIPLLLQTPAAKRFVSLEPMLGPVTFLKLPEAGSHWDWLTGERATALDNFGTARLDWVIAGGESGHGARPSHPDWFRSLRDQCVAAGVAYFHKQNGEFAWTWEHHGHVLEPVRVGKKAAGRLLDGREWNQVPEVKCA